MFNIVFIALLLISCFSLGCEPMPVSARKSTMVELTNGPSAPTILSRSPVEPSLPSNQQPLANCQTPPAGDLSRIKATLLGAASYYHPSLAGESTANGETYDPASCSAAHRHLPFGAWLRVTRLDTKVTVYVRVNDRGPFGRARRLLDLSYAAAKALDMLQTGVVQVRVEILSIN